MNKSTITRERLQEIAEDGFLKHGESKELARMALAAMDSEPVILYRERNPYNGLTTGWQELTENELSFLKENAGENAEFLKLYRHAQPAVSKPWGYTSGILNPAVGMACVTPTRGKNQFPVYLDPQPAPVVPDFKKLALELVGNLVDCGGLDEGVKERYLEWTEKTCRAAMLVATPQEVKP